MSTHLLYNPRIAVLFPVAKEAFLSRDFRFYPLSSIELRSSGLLRSETTTGCVISQKGAVLNLLKPTGHVMHQQFNIQQLYALLTHFLCVLYLSENKQRLVPLTA